MRYSILLAAASLFCAHLAAETVITNQGVVVQGKVLRSTDSTITIEIPLYGGITVRRDAIERVYGPGVNVEQTEEQGAVNAVMEANRKQEAEREELRKTLALKEGGSEERLIPPPTGSKTDETGAASKKRDKADSTTKKATEPAAPKSGKKPTDTPAPTKKPADTTPLAKAPLQKVLDALKPAAPAAVPAVAPAAAPVPAAPKAPVAPAPVPAPAPAAAPKAP